MFRLNFLSALTLSALTTPLLAQDFALSSQVQGYAATLGSDLPAAPDGRVQDCHAITPQTRAGKDIAARGWQVISALLRKSRVGRGSPFPGQTYPTASVTGMPSAV